jgi:hypothetical protein
MPKTNSISKDSRLLMNPNAVEARMAGARIGIVIRSKAPKVLLPEVCAASSSAASIALKAGVIKRNRTEVLKAKWHQMIPQYEKTLKGADDRLNIRITALFKRP